MKETLSAGSGDGGGADLLIMKHDNGPFAAAVAPTLRA